MLRIAKRATLALLLIVVTLIAAWITRSALRDRSGDLSTIAVVDLSRFMGSWYVIANIPYFAERGYVATRDEYSLRDDGRVDNVYVYRKSFNADEKRIVAIAQVVPGHANAQWKIGFFGVLKVDYLILEIAPDYSWALIGYPDRSLGWIFSRSANMADEVYAQLLARMHGYGYTIGSFRRVAQFPEQVGQAGFQ